MSSVVESRILDDFFDLMVNQPSPKEILEFKMSVDDERKITKLIELTHAESLSFQDQAEIDYYFRIERAIVLAKAKAYAKLQGDR
ncbi:hypothetical protein [Neolewinella sp.]|uniref:hypothetical protein n=1 Tax=Neolewinella sp. TaxID=2993543 RepID=UPI003B52043D